MPIGNVRRISTNCIAGDNYLAVTAIWQSTEGSHGLAMDSILESIVLIAEFVEEQN